MSTPSLWIGEFQPAFYTLSGPAKNEVSYPIILSSQRTEPCILSDPKQHAKVIVKMIACVKCTRFHKKVNLGTVLKHFLKIYGAMKLVLIFGNSKIWSKNGPHGQKNAFFKQIMWKG